MSLLTKTTRRLACIYDTLDGHEGASPLMEIDGHEEMLPVLPVLTQRGRKYIFANPIVGLVVRSELYSSRDFKALPTSFTTIPWPRVPNPLLAPINCRLGVIEAKLYEQGQGL